MVKALFFDTGPIITLVMSRMVWILPELKKKYGGTLDALLTHYEKIIGEIKLAESFEDEIDKLEVKLQERGW